MQPIALDSRPTDARDFTDVLERILRFKLQDDQAEKWDDLSVGVKASPMRVEDLPENIRGWLLQGGTYLLRIFPKESLWEEHALTRFITEVQSVDPQVVGNPASIHVFAKTYRSARISASIYAVMAILMLLMLTLRDIRLTLLALATTLGG